MSDKATHLGRTTALILPIKLRQGCNFIKKETLPQVLSCEFCEIFKNTFCTEHLWWLLLIHAKLRIAIRDKVDKNIFDP